MIDDVFEGKGTLRRMGPPPEEWDVRYQFVIHTRVVERPGFPRVAGKSSADGTVSAVNSEFIPDGEYQLIAEDGEVLRVANVGLGDWTILSS